MHNELNYTPEKSPFWQDNALFASKAKLNVFWNFLGGESQEGTWSEEKALILVFKVIVQHLKLEFFRVLTHCATVNKKCTHANVLK